MEDLHESVVIELPNGKTYEVAPNVFEDSIVPMVVAHLTQDDVNAIADRMKNAVRYCEFTPSSEERDYDFLDRECEHYCIDYGAFYIEDLTSDEYKRFEEADSNNTLTYDMMREFSANVHQRKADKFIDSISDGSIAHCVIRWKDSGEYVANYGISINGTDSDDVGFVLDSPSELKSLMVGRSQEDFEILCVKFVD